jgi:predicted phage tail component-like protein
MGTDLTFKGTSLRQAVPGVRITNIIRPARPPYERNKVVIPGRDGSYDFGNNRKEDFLITVEVVIEADSAKNLQTRIGTLSTFLDGKGNLVFSDNPSKVYTAQVYDEVAMAGDATARWARSLIIFECDAGGVG